MPTIVFLKLRDLLLLIPNVSSLYIAQEVEFSTKITEVVYSSPSFIIMNVVVVAVAVCAADDGDPPRWRFPVALHAFRAGAGVRLMVSCSNEFLC